MLQLAHNTLADKATIVFNQGNIDFKYIKRLHNLQKQQVLKFGNMLSGNHILYENQKTNVNIAAQTLSARVADGVRVFNE